MKLNLVLIAVLIVSVNAAAQAASQQTNSRAALEQQLWKLDQQWLDAVQNRKMAFLDQMWTSHFIEILPGGRVVTKADQMKRLSETHRKPGTGSTRDDFKLLAVYGNVALATDHMTQKGTKVYGRDITGDYRVTRVFVKEGGKWRAAASALVPIGLHPSKTVNHEASHGSEPMASYSGLEKELWEIDLKWEAAARNHDLDYLKQIWTRQLFIVLPGGHVVDKPELLAVVEKAPRGPNVGPFPDDFKLRAVYGNFAIGTDRTVIKGAALPNPHAAGAYRIIKFFVKQNGQWRVAGAADVAITSP